MYIRVPAVDGVPQVGDRHVINAISIPSEAICEMMTVKYFLIDRII